MSTITGKLLTAGLLFLFTLVSGVIVSHSSRPLNIFLVTIHKLIAVGTVVLVGMAVNQIYKTIDGTTFLELTILTVSAILFIALIATGSFLTREEMQLPEFVLKIHQVAPLLALASSSLMVYLLVKGNS